MMEPLCLNDLGELLLACVEGNVGNYQVHWKPESCVTVTLAAGGYPGQAEIELTYNWGTESYELGTAYGHIALGVEDIQATCEAMAAKGGRVVRPPGAMKHGTTVIAFVEDPDGYKVELIQLASRA